MHRNYQDILALTDKTPVWFDENAVPRFITFHPNLLDIYADEAVLFLIRCQSCDHMFRVAVCQSRFDSAMAPFSAAIVEKELHYGDPPNVECCLAGPSMNSKPIRVLEYWRRDEKMCGWTRNESYEIDLAGEP